MLASSCNYLSRWVETGKTSDAVREVTFRPYKYLRRLGRARTTIGDIVAAPFVLGAALVRVAKITSFQFLAVCPFLSASKSWDCRLFSVRFAKMGNYLFFRIPDFHSGKMQEKIGTIALLIE